MEGTIIPLPSAYAGLPSSVRGHRDEVAVATIEFVPTGLGSGVPSQQILDRIRERCVRAALVTLGRCGITPVLAGTTAHPVIEGVFDGDDADQHAADASIDVIVAVRETQRAQERFLAACAGLGHGTTVRASGTMVPYGRGVQVTTGSPAVVADRLRERAGQGEVLFGGEMWADVADELGADRLADLQQLGGDLTVPVWRVGPGSPGRAGR